MCPLGDFMVSRAGTVTPSRFPAEEFELYSIAAHDQGAPEVTQGFNIGSAKQIVQPGDVMVAKIIPHIRRARVVDGYTGRRQIASGEWIVFRSDRHDPSYFRHYLLSDQFHRQFMNTVAGVGGSLVRARPKFVKMIEVPSPSLAAQRRIAAILDKADDLRAARRDVLDKLEVLARSVFQHMFGDPSTWPARWPMGCIGEMTEDVQYGTSGKAGDFGAWPIVRMGNVTDDGRLDLSDLKWIDLADRDVPKFTVRRGDLLFNRTNSKVKVGKTCVVTSDEPLAFAGYLVRVRFKPEYCPEFVNAFMTSRYGQALRQRMAKTAVNQANINAREMQSIPIAVPPKALLSEFAGVLACIDTDRQRQLAVLAEYEELLSSLQTRAFLGQL